MLGTIGSGHGGGKRIRKTANGYVCITGNGRGGGERTPKIVSVPVYGFVVGESEIGRSLARLLSRGRCGILMRCGNIYGGIGLGTRSGGGRARRFAIGFVEGR